MLKRNLIPGQSPTSTVTINNMSTSASGIIDSSLSSSSYIDSVEVWAAAKIIGYTLLIHRNDNKWTMTPNKSIII